jgi:hypothetical protein
MAPATNGTRAFNETHVFDSAELHAWPFQTKRHRRLGTDAALRRACFPGAAFHRQQQQTRPKPAAQLSQRSHREGLMNDLAEVIEEAIDRFSLTVLLDTIEEVCDGRALHLASDWQDVRSAKVWSQAARRIDRIRGFASDHNI